MNEAFWARYHIKFHPTATPSDFLVSKLFKQMEKRLLTVDDVWHTKSLAHQSKAERKRTKLAENVELIAKNEEADVTHVRNVMKYLSLMHTYLVALSKAGCKPVKENLPKEVRSSDSTNFVHVPFDVLLAYYERASRKALAMLEDHKEFEVLKWLVPLD